MNQSDLMTSSLDFSAMAQMRAQAQQDDSKVMRESAEQFESIFINMMIKSMRDATERSGMLDSEAGKMYESMMDQELASQLAKQGVFGVADALEAQMQTLSSEKRPHAGPIPLTPKSFEIRQDDNSYQLERVSPNRALPLDKR